MFTGTEVIVLLVEVGVVALACLAWLLQVLTRSRP